MQNIVIRNDTNYHKILRLNKPYFMMTYNARKSSF